LRLFCQCLALLLVLGCTPGADLPPVPAGSGEYRLGPGDAVRLITFGEDGLTGEFRVSDAGTIAVPLLGGVRAEGLTPAELEPKSGSWLIVMRSESGRFSRHEHSTWGFGRSPWG
jgi:polysaccharide export outer membrane protein